MKVRSKQSKLFGLACWNFSILHTILWLLITFCFTAPISKWDEPPLTAIAFTNWHGPENISNTTDPLQRLHGATFSLFSVVKSLKQRTSLCCLYSIAHQIKLAISHRRLLLQAFLSELLRGIEVNSIKAYSARPHNVFLFTGIISSMWKKSIPMLSRQPHEQTLVKGDRRKSFMAIFSFPQTRYFNLIPISYRIIFLVLYAIISQLISLRPFA